MRRNVVRRRLAEDEAFEQAVRREAVGAVQARLRALARCVEAGQIGAAVAVHDDAAAGVMLRRHDGDRPGRHVDAEADQLFVNVGKVAAHEFGGHVADVEVDVVEAVALDLGVDRARHHVARREFGARIVVGHEAMAGARVEQPPALAANGLRDEEVLDVEIVEAGRVELHEFHVGDARAGPPRHRDAVAGRALRRGREQIGSPRAAGGEDRRAGGVESDGTRGAINGIDAPDVARARIALLVARGGQVDNDLVGNERDVGVRGGSLEQRLLHRPAGGIGDVDDAAVRMAALARQVQRVAFGRERDAELLEAGDGGGRALHHHFDDATVVEAGAGDHRVVDMAGKGVARLQHGRDAALRPGGRALVQRALGEHRHAEALGEIERRRQSRRARADDEDVALL